MNDSKVKLIGILFFLLCLGIIGAIWYVDRELRASREQFDELEQSRANLERDRNALREQIDVFNAAFRNLEGHNVRPAASDMDFLSEAQMVVNPRINNNEIVIITQRQHGVRDGRTSISLTLRGNYYSFMEILAGWRNLHTTARVAELSMSSSRTPQPQIRGEIQADVVLEAIIAQ